MTGAGVPPAGRPPTAGGPRLIEDAIAALRNAGIKVAPTTGLDREVTDPLAAGQGAGQDVDAAGRGRPTPVSPHGSA